MEILAEPRKQGGLFFVGLGRNAKAYPAWRYHKFLEPRIVEDEKEDEKARLEGWHKAETPITANRSLQNWRYDLEDLSAKQLSVYAKEEFDIDLPAEAGVEKLLQSIWRLSMSKPENKGRIALLAQSVKMNYDETVKEIQEHADNFDEWETVEVCL